MSISSYATPSPALQREVKRRRSFAIISHPDAGKTTLTEKFLLYGGALNLAGSVTARKNQRATTSDWMELEKQRGISVHRRCCNSNTRIAWSTFWTRRGTRISRKIPIGF